MSNSQNKNAGIGCGLEGRYRVQVVNDKTNEVEKDYGWHKNLILNIGMNRIGVQQVALCDLSLYGIAGTGSRPNSITSSTSQASQSGTSIYLSNISGLPDFTSSYSSSVGTGSYTASVDVGDVIKFTDTTESMVTAITDGYHVEVTPSYTSVSEQTFTIWKTSQVALQKEVKRSNDYLTGAGNCGTTLVGNVQTHRRTYDFTAETSASAVNYSEVGVSWAATNYPTTNSVFSRVVLPETVSVAVDYKLRLTYDLQITWTPESASYFTMSVSGWPVDAMATQSIQTFLASTVDTTGAANAGTAVLDPSYDFRVSETYYQASMFASCNSAVLTAFNTATDRSSGSGYVNGAVEGNYVGNSFIRYKAGTLDLNSANSKTLHSIGFGQRSSANGWFPYDVARQAFCVRFNDNQAKTNLQTLTLCWKWVWSRVLQ